MLNSENTGLIKHKPKRKIKVYSPAQQARFLKKAPKHKPKTEVLMIFAQQLAAMLKASLPIVDALKALQSQGEDPVFAVIIQDLCAQIENGVTLSQALSKYPQSFSTMFVSMVEAGEASGKLPELIDKLSSYLKASVTLNKKVKSALVYPAVVIGMAIMLVMVLMIFVIPVFQDMFKSFGSKLPLPTQILIDISNFLQAYILFIGAFIALMVYMLKRYFSSPKGKRTKDAIIKSLPIAGILSQKVNVARFCKTYSILLKSGVSLLKCIHICSNASENTFVAEACTNITRVVNQGGQLSEAILDEPYFPLVMVQMVKAGEKTGNVDTMLNSVAEFFETEIDTMVSTLTSLIEPFLIAFLGIVVGSIVISMFLPIFELSSIVQ
jgi:type IV pilus assembly protein PilC